MILELIARTFPKAYNKVWAAVNTERIVTGNMVLAFSDTDGVSYYRFHQDMSLPIERLPYLMSFWEQLMNGMSSDELLKIVNVIEASLESGLKDPKTKSAAKIGACVQEIKYRMSTAGFHEKLYYDILAISIIRQDEDPMTFNEVIHVEKIAAFKELQKKKGAYNFFKDMPELSRLAALFNRSEDEWQTLWMQSLAIQARAENIEKIFT
jgi:hypothetical protein